MVANQPAQRILVVDDDQDLRTTIVEFLNMQGFEALEAGDGLEALLQVKRARPSAIVLDIMMPRLGGLQALKRIRAFDPNITVVVVTGVTDAELHRQAMVLGACAVFVKPVTLADIAAMLRGEVLSPREDLKPFPAPPPAKAGRILLVDDEAEIRATFEEFFTEKNYDVREAADGASAIKAVVEDAPDIVLLDIQMPGLGGVEALAAIRTVAPDVKVIMVSGTSDNALASRALAYGAFDYVTKPVDLVYLDRSVETALMMRNLERG